MTFAKMRAFALKFGQDICIFQFVNNLRFQYTSLLPVTTDKNYTESFSQYHQITFNMHYWLENTIFLDSEDDFRSGCRHASPQQN